MSFTVAPTQDAVYAAVKAFVMAALPLDSAHVIKGNQNRVAMPSAPFVVMNIATMTRLRTNVDLFDSTIPDPTSMTREQGVMAEMQLDVYGPGSGDMANILTTLWRDPYGCDALGDTCQPLYAEIATQAPLVTGEEQYLERYIVRARLQYNPVVSVTQDFASVVEVDVISVDQRYPPS